ASLPVGSRHQANRPSGSATTSSTPTGSNDNWCQAPVERSCPHACQAPLRVVIAASRSGVFSLQTGKDTLVDVNRRIQSGVSFKVSAMVFAAYRPVSGAVEVATRRTSTLQSLALTPAEC